MAVPSFSVFESLEAVGRTGAGRCIAVGTFDGVHIGHKALIDALGKKARTEGLEATVVTFKNHPAEVVAPERAPKLLTPWQMKRRLLGDLGVATVIGLDFDPRLASIRAEAFVREHLVAGLQMKCMVAGPTFGFGAGRTGGIRLLETMSGALGFDLEVVEKIDLEGRSVSSSSIRRLVEAGDMEAAAPLLGRDFSILGVVTRGSKRGREMGFPTVNLECDPRQILPADGVYAGRATFDGEERLAAAHVGPQPTFGVEERTVEAYLLGFEGDLYGRSLEIAFKTRLRAIKSFSSSEELSAQMRADVEAVQRASPA